MVEGGKYEIYHISFHIFHLSFEDALRAAFIKEREQGVNQEAGAGQEQEQEQEQEAGSRRQEHELKG